MRLKKLKNINRKRRENVQLYRENLKINILGCQMIKKMKLIYVMFLTEAEKRDELQKYLSKYNIQSLIYYGTPLLVSSNKNTRYKKGSLP